MRKNNDHSEVSWGNVLADDALVWLPHALCRHADKLELTFDDIGFIAQCFSFRGKTGIHPSESTLAIRGGYNTRNPIINRFKRLEEMNLINRHRIRYEDGTFGTYRYDFSPLREKLEQLVKAEWASGERKPKQRSDSKEPIHVDDNQHGEYQHDDHQHDERQHKKLKGIETQGFSNAEDKETNAKTLIVPEKSQERHSEKPKFPSYRKRLKGDELDVFDLIAENFDKVVGKTLLEFVQQSTTAITGAYEECKQREVKHFSYFTKVFFSHLQKGVKDGGTATVDYDNIDEGLYK